MAQPYMGEIRMFAGNFQPLGWAYCDGRLLPISEYDALFTLIGTTYGGDGQENFALPNLQGRIPMHAGNGFTLAESGGVESVTLTTQQIPIHTHAFLGAEGNGTQANPSNTVLATSTIVKLYAHENADAAMDSKILQPQGGSQPHENMQPYLCVTFIISLYGIYPTQN